MIKDLSHKIINWIPSTWHGRIACTIVFTWVIIALLSPLISNDKPILAKGQNGWTIPILNGKNLPLNVEYELEINPLIRYRFNNIDTKNSLKPPFTRGEKGIHLLGTDKLGRDVAAGMINGARVAFLVATIAILLSSILGIFIGLIIGFYGDHGIQKNILQQLSILLLGIFSTYYLLHFITDQLSIFNIIPLLVLFTLGFILDKLLGKIPLKKYGLPVDLMVQRLFEINESIPNLFILLAFLAIVVNTSLYTIPLILSILVWMTFARHARAEALQIKNEDYILSARSSGMSDLRLLIKHILPNALPSLLVIVAFSFSAVILLESTLSFLGIGLPLEEMSWGKILAEARKTPKSWWLAVFPGLAIFLVLYAFNTLGDLLANYQRNQDQTIS